ncbi:IS1634 family transposase [Methylacidimicrobium cyclopophantes]
MYLCEVKSRQKGKVYKSYFIRESYRSERGPRARTICNVTALPEEVRELIRLGLQGKRVAEVEALGLEEQSDFGGLAVLREAWERWGLEEVLASVEDPKKRKLLQALIFGRILFPCSKLSLKEEARGTLLAQACSLEKSEGFEEEDLYRAMDGLNGVWSRIERGLFRRAFSSGVRLVLYDLSSTYFEGEGPKGLARYGYSRDHREERPQVILAVATDAEGIPIHVEVLRGNRADSTTLPGLLVTLRRRLGIAKAVFVFDGGIRSFFNLEVLTGMELGYVSWATRAQLQELVDKLPRDRQPEIWDRTEGMEVEKDGLRYVIAGGEWRAKRDRERREARIAKAKLLLEEFKRNARKGEDAVRLGSRVGRMLERCKAHKYFRYGIDGEGRFWWKLHEEEIAKEEATDGWYLLETNLLPTEASAKEVLAHYQNLGEVEQAFCELKSYLEVRPVFHWRPDRVRNHVRICFLAYWMTARLAAEWSKLGVFEHVPRLLRRLQTIRLGHLSVKGKPVARLLTKIPPELNRLLGKLHLLPIFSQPPGWATL